MVAGVEAATGWRGSRDTTRKRLIAWIIVSLLLHSPLTPLAALFGLAAFWRPGKDTPEEPAELLTAIPVDLLSDQGPEPAGGPEAKPSEPEQPSAEPSKDLAVEEPKPKKVEPKPERSHPVTDAGADGEAPLAVADAGADGPVAGKGSSIGDPVALSGTAGRIADSNANVRLIVYTDRIRHQTLGARVGALLGQAYQWRDFFGPAGLDPIKDVDRILIAGPQLRDSSQVVAVLKYNVSEGRMRQAIDAIVRRDPANGGWLDAGVPAASARADRAERVFVMPTPGIVAVVPRRAAKNLQSLRGATIPAPKGPEIMTGFMVTPWRAFRGLPVRIPESISWARMQVLPGADGNATVELEAQDESAESARENAEQLQRALDALTQINLGILGSLLGKKEHRMVERVTFTSSGTKIQGKIVITPSQLSTLIEGAAQYAKDLAERNARRRLETSGDAGAATPLPNAPAPMPDAGRAR